MNPILDLKTLRKYFGFSQVKLAQLSGVSLPTIQNIEAGKANPSLSVLRLLLKALRHDIKILPQTTDWNALVHHGVPLTEPHFKKRKRPPSEQELLAELRLALLEYRSSHKTHERAWEALAGFLLGLKTHFPIVYDQLGELKPIAERLLTEQESPRLYQLRRMSISAQARYL